jgi:hypothetical protein
VQRFKKINTIENRSISCFILSTRTKLSLSSQKTLLSLLPLLLCDLAGDQFLKQKKFPKQGQSTQRKKRTVKAGLIKPNYVQVRKKRNHNKFLH